MAASEKTHEVSSSKFACGQLETLDRRVTHLQEERLRQDERLFEVDARSIAAADPYAPPLDPSALPADPLTLTPEHPADTCQGTGGTKKK